MAPEKRKRSDRMSAKTRKVYLLYRYYPWDRTEKRKRTPENGRHRQENSSLDDPLPAIAWFAHSRKRGLQKKAAEGCPRRGAKNRPKFWLE